MTFIRDLNLSPHEKPIGSRRKGLLEISSMISNAQEYQNAQEELRHLEDWLAPAA
jgi:hypothetical protein